MKLQFEEYKYQQDAINSVVRLFNDMPKFEKTFQMGDTKVIANIPQQVSLDDEFLYENLLDVQDWNIEENGIKLSRSSDFEKDRGEMLEGISNDIWEYPNFTVEMETGTGKTFVYLRTIHELYHQKGFNKFIIVVPSVAIRIGVRTGYESMKDDFKKRYGNDIGQLFEYSSSNLSQLRTFATSDALQIMVITIQAMNSQSNKIYQATEKLQGEWKPFEYIQATRPIIVLDEPQNMESKKSKEVLRTLCPLFGLRYSATHKTTPNPIYRLTPVEAFRESLVKKIQVIGVTEEENNNQPLLKLLSAKRTPKGIRAKVLAYSYDKGKVEEKQIELKQKDDLFKKTKHEDYKRKGYVVENIVVGDKGFIEFTNSEILYLNGTIGISKPALIRHQIRNTILEHIERQKALKEKGIKVISLFFIDRVKSYVGDNPIIKNIFDEEYLKLRSKYEGFKDLEPDEVQASYFASYRSKPKGQAEKTEYVDDVATNEKQRQAERDQFELIMKKKNQLLSFKTLPGEKAGEEQRCFIFAHSALKEGWDNPNVFQICTLRETISVTRKRQEIGRGLRLPVNQEGKRIADDEINILTVVANESYEEFADKLQREYIKDGETEAPPPPKPKRSPAKRNDDIYKSKAFKEFWSLVSKESSYKIKVDTPQLIKDCVARLKETPFPLPKVVVTKGGFDLVEYTFTIKEIKPNYAKVLLEVEKSKKVSGLQFGSKKNVDEFTLELKENMDLTKFKELKQLRKFKVHSISADSTEKFVKFDNGEIISNFKPLSYTTRIGQKKVKEPESAIENYQVFNFLDRAARETGLTKTTLITIFNKIGQDKQRLIFQNPEGFVGTFIGAIKEELANHVTANLEFEFSDMNQTYDLDDIFPKEIKHVQREMIPGNDVSLYNKVQIDSDVEESFVSNRLNKDYQVVFYFKFPSKFRIDFPKIIGNYNPDWGIVRKSNDEKYTLQLVRETKGTTDINKLRFPHEKRKVRCAKKHFEALNIDYRAIDDKVVNWWLSHEKDEQGSLDVE